MLGREHREILANAVVSFGKHKGRTWLWIYDNDESYARWALDNIEYLPDDIRDALEALLG